MTTLQQVTELLHQVKQEIAQIEGIPVGPRGGFRALLLFRFACQCIRVVETPGHRNFTK